MVVSVLLGAHIDVDIVLIQSLEQGIVARQPPGECGSGIQRGLGLLREAFHGGQQLGPVRLFDAGSGIQLPCHVMVISGRRASRDRGGEEDEALHEASLAEPRVQL